jgi:transcriptional/translational regulatory protein YebC/TACO1
MEAALEAGAEDFKSEPEGFEIISDPAQFEAVHKAIEGRGIKCESAAVNYLPMVTAELRDPATAEAVTRLTELLEDHDDVKEIHSNAEFVPA